MNLVERWFAELTTKWLRRGTHTSVKDLARSIREWGWDLERRPPPLRLAQDSRRDLRQPRRILRANRRIGRLVASRKRLDFVGGKSYNRSLGAAPTLVASEISRSHLTTSRVAN